MPLWICSRGYKASRSIDREAFFDWFDSYVTTERNTTARGGIKIGHCIDRSTDEALNVLVRVPMVLCWFLLNIQQRSFYAAVIWQVMT